MTDHSAATEAEGSDDRYGYDCPHPSQELRRRVNRAGALSITSQCLTCGRSVRVLRKADFTPQAIDAMPAFDASLEERRNMQRREASAKTQREREEAWWAWYSTYLQSPAWRVKREKVFRRAGGWCEGCLEAPATQVHHKTYAHVGNELLFELAAICDACHERTHGDNIALPEELRAGTPSFQVQAVRDRLSQRH